MNVGLTALLLTAGGLAGFAAGVRAYDEGRFPDALAAFTAAERRAGDRASPELLCNQALAALRAGDLRGAQIAAEKVAVRGGSDFRPWRDFLLGNVAFQRGAAYEAQASGPEAEPFAFDLAIAAVDRARERWQRAAMTRADWPEARRNVERARRKLEELERKRDEAREKKAEEPPEEEPAAPEDMDEELAPVEAQPIDRGPDLVRRLLGKLENKAAEKRDLRRATREERASEVERDW